MNIKGWVRLGDKAACGSVVVEGCQNIISHGRPLAYIGSAMACPFGCRIIEGDATTILPNRKNAVLHGHRTSMGCPVISSLNDANGQGALPGEPIVNKFYSDPSNPPSEKTAGGWLPATHDDHFVIANPHGEPIPHVPYRIQLEDGRIEEGITDMEGKTHVLTQTLNAQDFHVWIKAPTA